MGPDGTQEADPGLQGEGEGLRNQSLEPGFTGSWEWQNRGDMMDEDILGSSVNHTHGSPHREMGTKVRVRPNHLHSRHGT